MRFVGAHDIDDADWHEDENVEAAREAELRDFRESQRPARWYTETMDEEWWGDA